MPNTFSQKDLALRSNFSWQNNKKYNDIVFEKKYFTDIRIHSKTCNFYGPSTNNVINAEHYALYPTRNTYRLK